MESSLTLVPKLVIEHVVDSKLKMASSPRRCRVIFDPPLDFNVITNVPRAPFPSRLTITQGGSCNENVRFAQSSGDASSTRKGNKVWVEIPEKEKKEKNDRQHT